MFFRSERLFLRPAWPEDAAAIYDAIGDEADGRWLAGPPQDARFPQCLITRPGAHGAELVGYVGLRDRQGEAELSYGIAGAYAGQGYAEEALRAMLSMARGLGHRRVIARHGVDNPASGRVLAQVGFRPIGTIEDGACLARGGVSALNYACDLAAAVAREDDRPDDGMKRRCAA